MLSKFFRLLVIAGPLALVGLPAAAPAQVPRILRTGAMGTRPRSLAFQLGQQGINFPGPQPEGQRELLGRDRRPGLRGQLAAAQGREPDPLGQPILDHTRQDRAAAQRRIRRFEGAWTTTEADYPYTGHPERSSRSRRPTGSRPGPSSRREATT